jgi:hypothetical protein
LRRSRARNALDAAARNALDAAARNALDAAALNAAVPAPGEPPCATAA